MKCLGWIVVVFIISVSSCLAHAPDPRENPFFKIEAAGIMGSKSKSGPALEYGFAFLLKKPIKITRVRVEDISGSPPVILVDDRKPKIAKDRWRGNSAPLSLTPANYPWMFDGSDTRKWFRVTVSALNQSDIALVQPTKFYASAKQLLLKFNRPKPAKK